MELIARFKHGSNTEKNGKIRSIQDHFMLQSQISNIPLAGIGKLNPVAQQRLSPTQTIIESNQMDQQNSVVTMISIKQNDY